MPPGAPHRESLLQPRGAFVTLHVAGELRGCIGRVDADTPLYLAVEQLPGAVRPPAAQSPRALAQVRRQRPDPAPNRHRLPEADALVAAHQLQVDDDDE